MIRADSSVHPETSRCPQLRRYPGSPRGHRSPLQLVSASSPPPPTVMPSLQAPSRPAPKSHPRVPAKSCSPLHGCHPRKPHGADCGHSCSGAFCHLAHPTPAGSGHDSGPGHRPGQGHGWKQPLHVWEPCRKEAGGNHGKPRPGHRAEERPTPEHLCPDARRALPRRCRRGRCRGLEQVQQDTGTHRPAVPGTRGPRVTGREPRAVPA